MNGAERRITASTINLALVGCFVLGSYLFFKLSRRRRDLSFGSLSHEPPDSEDGSPSNAPSLPTGVRDSKSSSRTNDVTIILDKEHLSDEHLRESPDFRGDLADFLNRILETENIVPHVIICIDPHSDEEEKILTLFEELKLFEAGLERHRVIFCETLIGRVHVVRHICPLLHVDFCRDTSEQLVPHIYRVYLIGEQGEELPLGLRGALRLSCVPI